MDIYSFVCVFLKHSYPPNMQILCKIERNVKFLSFFEAHPLQISNFISYKADMFNRKEQLKHSDLESLNLITLFSRYGLIPI